MGHSINGEVDLLVVGSGPVGCVIAERAAALKGWRSVIIEKRGHIAGNCYDYYHDGVLVHRYGPHYFRTSNKALIDYLSFFTRWINGNYVVKSYIGGRLFPFPINRLTLEQFFGQKFTSRQAQNFLKKIREPYPKPANSEEVVLSRVGRQLYESFYLGYTVKQWGKHPKELDPAVCGRVPVYYDEDERYSTATYQLMPQKGFTEMFLKMVQSPLITVWLNTDFFQVRDLIKPRIATVYCGPIDDYFDRRFGPLGYRSLGFKLKTFPKTRVQPCVQINYPLEHAYTRSVEFKHVTRQRCPRTVISYEYPSAEGDPYYPIMTRENARKLKAYLAAAEQERLHKHVYFVGRLAQYRYLDMDEAFIAGLEAFEQIVSDAMPSSGHRWKKTLFPLKTTSSNIRPHGL